MGDIYDYVEEETAKGQARSWLKGEIQGYKTRIAELEDELRRANNRIKYWKRKARENMWKDE